ncbi:MAG: anti-sigma factor family protein [Candidatus Brocadiia bacterium]
MKCVKIQRLLSEYLDGELCREDRRAVEQHLASCDRCERRLEELRRTVEAVADLPPETAPDGFCNDVLGRIGSGGPAQQKVSYLERWQKPMMVAAMFLVVAGVIALLPSETAHYARRGDHRNERESYRREEGPISKKARSAEAKSEETTEERTGAESLQRESMAEQSRDEEGDRGGGVGDRAAETMKSSAAAMEASDLDDSARAGAEIPPDELPRQRITVEAEKPFERAVELLAFLEGEDLRRASLSVKNSESVLVDLVIEGESHFRFMERLVADYGGYEKLDNRRFGGHEQYLQAFEDKAEGKELTEPEADPPPAVHLEIQINPINR